jgi:peroxiredoxin
MSAGLYLDRPVTSSSRWWILGIISLLLVIAVVLVVSFNTQSRSLSIDPTLPLLRIDGTSQTIDHFHGKPLLITFWSPSCVICMHEVEDFNRLYRKLEGGSRFEMLGISMYYDRPDWVVETSQDRNMLYPVYFDLQKTIATAFGGVIATPTSFLLDADGAIVYRHTGALDFRLLEQKLDQLTG